MVSLFNMPGLSAQANSSQTGCLSKHKLRAKRFKIHASVQTSAVSGEHVTTKSCIHQGSHVLVSN